MNINKTPDFKIVGIMSDGSDNQKVPIVKVVATDDVYRYILFYDEDPSNDIILTDIKEGKGYKEYILTNEQIYQQNLTIMSALADMATMMLGGGTNG